MVAVHINAGIRMEASVVHAVLASSLPLITEHVKVIPEKES